jgi:hypothetical protein
MLHTVLILDWSRVYGRGGHHGECLLAHQPVPPAPSPHHHTDITPAAIAGGSSVAALQQVGRRAALAVLCPAATTLRPPILTGDCRRRRCCGRQARGGAASSIAPPPPLLLLRLAVSRAHLGDEIVADGGELYVLLLLLLHCSLCKEKDKLHCTVAKSSSKEKVQYPVPNLKIYREVPYRY